MFAFTGASARGPWLIGFSLCDGLQNTILPEVFELLNDEEQQGIPAAPTTALTRPL